MTPEEKQGIGLFSMIATTYYFEDNKHDLY